MPFVSGHALSAALYAVVEPVLRDRFADLPVAAALAGRGSDVLGYDTERSADHDWGPRVVILVPADPLAEVRDPLLTAVEAVLPDAVRGVPVDHRGTRLVPDGEVSYNNTAGRPRPHGVTVTSLPELVDDVLGLTLPEGWQRDPTWPDPACWLALPQQCLLELTAGPVHRDDTGELTMLRDRLAFYPHDVWLHQMAARWQRIAQLEAFVGRTGEVGDDLGSRVVAAAITRDAMHLGLLQERRYAPYAKWLGTAFAATPAAAEVGPHLAAALAAATWQDREAAVVRALTALGARHDALEVTEPVAAEPQQFFERPFRVLFVEAYADALRSAVRDPVVAALPHDLGGIDPITDSTMALANRSLRATLTHWWRAGSGPGRQGPRGPTIWS